jgi:hypothetical protein
MCYIGRCRRRFRVADELPLVSRRRSAHIIEVNPTPASQATQRPGE